MKTCFLRMKAKVAESPNRVDLCALLRSLTTVAVMFTGTHAQPTINISSRKESNTGN